MAYLSYVYDEELGEYINIGGSDYTKIYYDTTENWNANRSISIKQALYVYIDAIQNGDSFIPKVKIGDGLAYIVDLPFVGDEVSATITNHIQDKIPHITQAERETWNRKCRIDESDLSNENLIFTIN